MPILGITGGIATGKSLFTASLAALVPALRVFDADQCSHGLTTSDPLILAAIRQQFGPGVFNDAGVLQRPALRTIVFSDPEKRKALEAILHPAIRRSWFDLAQAIRTGPGGSSLAVDIPLLFETSVEAQFDKVIVVACSASTQLQRLTQNRRLSPALAESMIASQLPLSEKISRADILIWNDGIPESLERQTRLLSQHLFA